MRRNAAISRNQACCESNEDNATKIQQGSYRHVATSIGEASRIECEAKKEILFWSATAQSTLIKKTIKYVLVTINGTGTLYTLQNKTQDGTVEIRIFFFNLSTKIIYYILYETNPDELQYYNGFQIK